MTGITEVAVVVVLLCGCAQAGVSVIMNGSFENNARSVDYIVDEPPYRWCDVDLPDYKFGGSIWSDWSTDGDFGLVIYSYEWANFDVNDLATVTQQVYLADAEKIVFDLQLDTTYNDVWDPNMRTAVLLIDDEVVWESSSVGGDVRGEYLNQAYVIDEKHKDGNSHALSLGLRADTEGTPWVEYRTRWDSVRLCGDMDYLPSDDPNYDCLVGFYDPLTCDPEYSNCEPLELEPLDFDNDGMVGPYELFALSSDWLEDGVCRGTNVYEPNDPAMAGVVDFRDFAVLARKWMHSDFSDGSE